VTFSRIRARTRTADLAKLLQLIALLLAPQSLHAVTLLEQDRGVFAKSHAADAGSFDEMIAGGEASDFSDFSNTSPTNASSTLATANASAEIDSSVAASLLTATGAVAVSALTTDADGRAEAPADSFFEIVFEATASEAYSLWGLLDAHAVLGDGFAKVELVNLDTGFVLVSEEAGVGDSVPYDASGTLVLGDRYRFTAFALAYALADPTPANVGADASFEATLYVPEPAAKLQLGAGICTLAALGGLRRRGRSRT